MTLPMRFEDHGVTERPAVTFVEHEGQNGAPAYTMSFVDLQPKPLSYEALLTARLHEPVTVPLDWSNAKLVATNHPDIDMTASYAGQTEVESPLASRTIALVQGGWLPSILALRNYTGDVLLDRNVVTEIVGRFDGGRLVGAKADFLDLLADQPVRLNPLLWVLEGNQKALPSPQLARQQLDEVVGKLTRALPHCPQVVGPESLRGALGLIEDSRPGFAAKQQFLLTLAPVLKSPVRRSLVAQRWAEVLACADACGVRRASLVVMAALSVVAVPNGASPAAKVLKFKEGYDFKDAYNALADLRSLEILIALQGMFPDNPPQIWTIDRPMAELWTAMGVSNIRRTRTAFSFDLTPIEAMMPQAQIAVWRAEFGAGAVGSTL